jgi:hypothetical protein
VGASATWVVSGALASGSTPAGSGAPTAAARLAIALVRAVSALASVCAARICRAGQPRVEESPGCARLSCGAGEARRGPALARQRHAFVRRDRVREGTLQRAFELALSIGERVLGACHGMVGRRTAQARLSSDLELLRERDAAIEGIGFAGQGVSRGLAGEHRVGEREPRLDALRPGRVQLGAAPAAPDDPSAGAPAPPPSRGTRRP